MDELAQFRETYIEECYDLLDEMEGKLMELNSDNADIEDLNAIFRCAHSIKGGAGAFGFNQIMEFTHVLEFMLDAMREGKIGTSQEYIDLLLRAQAIVLDMVQNAQNGDESEPEDTAEVKAKLKAISEGKDISEAETPSANNTAPAEEEDETAFGLFDDAPGAPEAEASPEECYIYNIKFIPNEEIFASGNEPLLIIRELATLGEISTEINHHKIPNSFNEIDHEICHVSWDIELESKKNFDDIKEVFEFVEDDCTLEIEQIAGFNELQKQNLPIELQSEPQSQTQNSQQDLAANTTESSTAQDKTKAQKDSKDNKNQQQQNNQRAVSSIRVDIDKVDRLVNMVGELVITQSMIQAQAQHVGQKYPALLAGVDELAQHSRDLQEAVMSVRMQPVKSVFSRMPRIVRDLARKLGKQIDLITKGEDTEVDKTVIEQLGDPLTHMIRNSVDHGVETPDVRIERGKDPQGTIVLSADNRGGKIIIEISDDGGGVNREKVLGKAIEKGLIAPNAQLSDEEIDHIIFMPGFSTAAAVSDVSGRGVGMDVVRRNIEAMGGIVTVLNRPLQGSTMQISLPLTLAILDGMIVKVGNENYIIPISSIVETFRPTTNQVRFLSNNQKVLEFRGEVVPIVYLHEVFDIAGAEHEASKSLIVLVENGRNKLGIVVDELLGQQQVVIKNLEENSDPIAGISGATILGDGKVSLIVDIAQIYELGEKIVNSNNNSYKKIPQELVG